MRTCDCEWSWMIIFLSFLISRDPSRSLMRVNDHWLVVVVVARLAHVALGGGAIAKCWQCVCATTHNFHDTQETWLFGVGRKTPTEVKGLALFPYGAPKKASRKKAYKRKPFYQHMTFFLRFSSFPENMFVGGHFAKWIFAEGRSTRSFWCLEKIQGPIWRSKDHLVMKGLSKNVKNHES